MNLSMSIMLVNKAVRPIRVSYDPDVPKNNGTQTTFFKTLDPTIKKDDLVVVETNTRHGFTVVKVEEVDFRLNFSDEIIQWKWIAGKVDKDGFDNTLKQEKTILDRVAEADENKKRAELAAAMGLGDIQFTDLDIARGTVALPTSSVRGEGNTVEERPAPPPEYTPSPAPTKDKVRADPAPFDDDIF